jgi:hypothetical protein
MFWFTTVYNTTTRGVHATQAREKSGCARQTKTKAEDEKEDTMVGFRSSKSPYPLRAPRPLPGTFHGDLQYCTP